MFTNTVEEAASIRELASRTGMGKDTVHPHLARLQAAGIISPLHTPSRFEPTRYRLHLATTGISRAHAPKAELMKRQNQSEQPALPFED